MKRSYLLVALGWLLIGCNDESEPKPWYSGENYQLYLGEIPFTDTIVDGNSHEIKLAIKSIAGLNNPKQWEFATTHYITANKDWYSTYPLGIQEFEWLKIGSTIIDGQSGVVITLEPNHTNESRLFEVSIGYDAKGISSPTGILSTHRSLIEQLPK